MSSKSHVLRKTDNALKAFCDAAAIAGISAVASPAFPSRVVREKETAGKELPVLICNSESAKRGRAKNWLVTGSLLLKTDPTTDENADNLATSDAQEDAVIEALEEHVPPDDRPQPLADAIQAAAVAAGVVAANEFLMTAFSIVNVSAGFDDDEVWTFSVDFTATVIA